MHVKDFSLLDTFERSQRRDETLEENTSKPLKYFVDDFFWTISRQAGKVVSRLRHEVQHLPQGVFRKSPESQSGDQKCRFSCEKTIYPQKGHRS